MTKDEREAVQQEADALLGLAKQLEQAAETTKRDAAGLRAYARGLKTGEFGLLPGWGYVYANMRVSSLLETWRKRP